MPTCRDTAALSFGECRTGVRLADRLTALARRLWPAKTAPHLASRADVSVRAAEMWLEGRNALSADALANLLRSDAGYAVLREIMEGSKTGWWRDFDRGVRIREIEERIEWQRAAIAALKSQQG